jgi:hypothetical protein
VEGSIWLVATRDDFPRLLVDAYVSTLCSEERCEHFAVRVEEPIEAGMRPGSTSVRFQQAGRARLFGCE